MSQTAIDQMMSLFDRKASLIIYPIEMPSPDESFEQIQVLSGNVWKSSPFDGTGRKDLSKETFEIAFSSIANALAESISAEKLTKSYDTAILRRIYFDEAISTLSEFIENNPNNGITLYKRWVERLVDHIISRSRSNPKRTLESLILDLSDRFRIDSLTVIRLLNVLAFGKSISI